MTEAAFKFPHQAILDHADTLRNFEVLQPLVGRHTADIDSLDRDVAQLERSLAVIRLPSAWTNPTGFSAKLEETTTCQVRSEQGATSARLKGFVKSKEALPANTTLFTLPAGFRPAQQARAWAVDVTAGTVLLLVIGTGGAVQNASEVLAAHFIEFDSITFHLT